MNWNAVSEEARASKRDAFRGMDLTWLSCWGNGLTTLEPLRGMPVNTLYCDANRIDSLDPLRGMPLKELRMWGCLEPGSKWI